LSNIAVRRNGQHSTVTRAVRTSAYWSRSVSTTSPTRITLPLRFQNRQPSPLATSLSNAPASAPT
jgi:hypothetical protein